MVFIYQSLLQYRLDCLLFISLNYENFKLNRSEKKGIIGSK